MRFKVSSVLLSMLVVISQQPPTDAGNFAMQNDYNFSTKPLGSIAIAVIDDFSENSF